MSQIQPHQQRVLDEKRDLDARLEKLRAFFGNPTFGMLPEDEQHLLIRQSEVMAQYSSILEARIAAFPKSFIDACAAQQEGIAAQNAEAQNGAAAETVVSQTKQFRKDMDEVLQRIKRGSERDYTGLREPGALVRSSRHRSLAITHVEDAIMRLGMDLKAINEENPGAAPNPYPESMNPGSPVVEPTADGLHL